jgi:hypothetical protein
VPPDTTSSPKPPPRQVAKQLDNDDGQRELSSKLFARCAFCGKPWRCPENDATIGLSANKLSDKAAIMLADMPASKPSGNHASMFASKHAGRTTNS